MNQRIVLDTDEHSLSCDWCDKPILGPIVIYGVSSVRYLQSYHPECDPERTELEAP